MYNKEHEVYEVLQKIGREITQKVKPRAVVVFSAHWQAKSDLIEVNNALMTDLIYESVLYSSYFLNSITRKADFAQFLWLPRLYV